MALFNGMMISHQELGRPMSHSHGSAGPWIDSTFEAKDVNLAYRLYKSSASIKAIPRYRDLGDFGQCWTPWFFLSKKDVVPFNISKESRSGPDTPRHTPLRRSLSGRMLSRSVGESAVKHQFASQALLIYFHANAELCTDLEASKCRVCLSLLPMTMSIFGIRYP